MTREVTEIRHDLRNLKMLVDGLSLETRELEMKVGSISTKIYTTISVAAVFASLIGFLFSVLRPLVE